MYYRIIVAIREHIMTEDALAGGGVGVGVYKAAGGGIVISALQIIEPGIVVVAVATGRRVLRLLAASGYNYESLFSIYHIFAGMTSAPCTQWPRRSEAKSLPLHKGGFSDQSWNSHSTSRMISLTVGWGKMICRASCTRSCISSISAAPQMISPE